MTKMSNKLNEFFDKFLPGTLGDSVYDNIDKCSFLCVNIKSNQPVTAIRHGLTEQEVVDRYKRHVESGQMKIFKLDATDQVHELDLDADEFIEVQNKYD